MKIEDNLRGTEAESSKEGAECEKRIEGRGERLLRLPEVMERVGLKRTAIYQRMREGRFPKSRSLGARCTIWLESEIDEWIRAIDGSSSATRPGCANQLPKMSNHPDQS